MLAHCRPLMWPEGAQYGPRACFGHPSWSPDPGPTDLEPDSPLTYVVGHPIWSPACFGHLIRSPDPCPTDMGLVKTLISSPDLVTPHVMVTRFGHPILALRILDSVIHSFGRPIWSPAYFGHPFLSTDPCPTDLGHVEPFTGLRKMI